MGVAFIIFPLITTAGVYLFYKRINERETNLIQNGIKGEAEILQREQTGTYLNELPQIKFQLQIKIPGKQTYPLEHKDYVSMLDLNAITIDRVCLFL